MYVSMYLYNIRIYYAFGSANLVLCDCDFAILRNDITHPHTTPISTGRRQRWCALSKSEEVAPPGRQRPYHAENTSSRPITEVKQHRARLVLGWVTAWEHRVSLSFCNARFGLLHVAPSSSPSPESRFFTCPCSPQNEHFSSVPFLDIRRQSEILNATPAAVRCPFSGIKRNMYGGPALVNDKKSGFKAKKINVVVGALSRARCTKWPDANSLGPFAGGIHRCRPRFAQCFLQLTEQRVMWNIPSPKLSSQLSKTDVRACPKLQCHIFYCLDAPKLTDNEEHKESRKVGESPTNRRSYSQSY